MRLRKCTTELQEEYKIKIKLEVVKVAKYVFGVDIGGTTVKLGFFSTEGVLLDKWEITTRKDPI